MTANKQIPLPGKLTVLDTKRAEVKYNKSTYEPLKTSDLNLNEHGDYGTLTLYYTERFGWCVRTLFISRGTRRAPDRYYGINMRGEIVSVGNGPHVKQETTVYIKKSNLSTVQFLIDLYNKGMESANDIRDRRSTRIANTRARNNAFGSLFG